MSSRASDAGPRRPANVVRNRVPSKIWLSPVPAAYGPWSSSPSRAEANRPRALAVISRRAPRRAPPSGQQMIRKATPPPSSAKHRYSSQRTTANRAPTRAPPDEAARAPTWVALGAPTEKVNAPVTRWVSAEITCQTAV